MSGALGAGAIIALSTACSAPRTDWVGAYYRYDFPTAREELREKAATNDDDVLLNNLRLGLASMADGNRNEAEQSLRRCFDLLSTAGLNKDRTTASVVLWEGVRIWKGEPFEQALAYYWTSALYAVNGDWDNARAAAANSLFRLTDFGRNLTQESLVRKAAADPKALEKYTAVDTNFALGFLMQAVGADRSGAGGATEQFDAALRIDPSLSPVVQILRGRTYDTLLLVDFGRGPRKVATGPDGAIAEFRDQETAWPTLSVGVDGVLAGNFPMACDVNRMARDHRWNNLEDVRRAKSFIGNVLLYGGAIATGVGAYNDSGAAAIAGVGAMLAGLYLKATAAADTRYCEFAPASIYVVPLQLGGPREVRLQAGGMPGVLVLPRLEPGTLDRPRAIYVRLLGSGSPTPPWMTSLELLYTNDATGIRAGDMPWVLGGTDVGTPDAARLAMYQQGGALAGWNVEQLVRAWTDLGYVIGAGRANRPDEPIGPSYRSVLEGGTGVFTPVPGSVGYKRIMYSPARTMPRVPAPPAPASPPQAASTAPE